MTENKNLLVGQFGASSGSNLEKKTVINRPVDFPVTETQIDRGAKVFEYVIKNALERFSGDDNQVLLQKIISAEKDIFTLITGITPTDSLESLSLEEQDQFFGLLVELGIAGEGKLIDRVQSPDITLESTGERYRDYHPYHYINRLSCAQVLQIHKLFKDNFTPETDVKHFLVQHLEEWIGVGSADEEVEKRFGVLSGFPPAEAEKFIEFRRTSKKIEAINKGELEVAELNDFDREILKKRQKYIDETNTLAPFFSFSDVGKTWNEYLRMLEHKYFVKQ